MDRYLDRQKFLSDKGLGKDLLLWSGRDHRDNMKDCVGSTDSPPPTLNTIVKEREEFFLGSPAEE